jgi:hypothetical protein
VLSRRRALHALGVVGLGLLAGCSAIDSDPKPGSLLVVNNSPQDQTLRLTIARDGSTDEPREETVSIGASEWGLRNGLLTDPGVYEVTVALARSENESVTTTVELTGGAGNLGGENLEAFIGEDGSLRVETRTYD